MRRSKRQEEEEEEEEKEDWTVYIYYTNKINVNLLLPN